VADGWCWFVLREKYCWLVVGGWFVLREKYCWLMADKPSEQAVWFNISDDVELLLNISVSSFILLMKLNVYLIFLSIF
jgi:hypothetical protein